MTLVEHLRYYVAEKEWPADAKWIALDGAPRSRILDDINSEVQFFTEEPTADIGAYRHYWNGAGRRSLKRLIPKHADSHMWAFTKEEVMAIDWNHCHAKVKADKIATIQAIVTTCLLFVGGVMLIASFIQ